MIRRPPRSTRKESSAASDVYKRQPPGYVGYDQGGILTEQINKNPYSVLLLDESEKANPDIFNILLQVVGHAILTDSNGRKTDFRNVTVIMTTNAGAEALSVSYTHLTLPTTPYV